jgi:hypothetical protein
MTIEDGSKNKNLVRVRLDDKHLSKRSTSEVLAMLANAKKTYSGAIGHMKAQFNDIRCHCYEQELIKRGVSIPTDDELLQVGVFNGDGSY